MAVQRLRLLEPHAIQDQARLEVVVPPEQRPSFVRDAHAVARSLGDDPLACVASICMNPSALMHAAAKDRLLAADPTTMPMAEGIHLIVSAPHINTVTFAPIGDDHAAELIEIDRMQEILFVDSSAVLVASTGNPIALGLDAGHININGYSDDRFVMASCNVKYNQRVLVPLARTSRQYPTDDQMASPGHIAEIRHGVDLTVLRRDGTEELLTGAMQVRFLLR